MCILGDKFLVIVMPRSRADRTFGNAWLFISRLQQKFSAPIFNTQHLSIDMGSCQAVDQEYNEFSADWSL